MFQSAAVTSVLLIRHGQTALNAQDRIRGLADPPLNETGVAQATATANSLKSFGLEALNASPLTRARQTAQIIATACGIDYQINAGFNDRDYGDFSGQLVSEVTARFSSIDLAPGVEGLAQVQSRARDALMQITADDGASRTLGIVSHDAVIRSLLTWIDPTITAAVPTASWALIERDSSTWRIVSVDNQAADS